MFGTRLETMNGGAQDFSDFLPFSFSLSRWYNLVASFDDRRHANVSWEKSTYFLVCCVLNIQDRHGGIYQYDWTHLKNIFVVVECQQLRGICEKIKMNTVWIGLQCRLIVLSMAVFRRNKYKKNHIIFTYNSNL